MKGLKRVFALAALGCAGAGLAQTAQNASPAVPATYRGCMTALSATTNDYVLASGDRCYYVHDASAAKGVGHEVVLRAVLIPQQGPQPTTLALKGAVTVRAACSQACTLQPPGTRGLGPHDKPGPEGATQGLTSPQPQP